MKHLVDKVLHHAARLDSVVDAFVNDRLRGDRLLTPSELLAAIAADVSRHVTVGADGPVFPFNRIAVTLAAVTAERESELRGALSAETVRLAIVSDLSRHVAVPPDLRIDVRTALTPAGAEPFTVTLRTAAVKRPPVTAPAPSMARLVSADGSARFTLGEGLFNIGRVSEIHGRDGRMVRRNQIVLGTDPAGGTVSRMHARIQGVRGGDSLTFTLFDDGSQRGSTVVRAGVPHTVVGGAVGVRLRDGDELYFGKVCLHFRLGDAAAP
jgi:hypothetical protein